jgi:hypothetical protein
LHNILRFEARYKKRHNDSKCGMDVLLESTASNKTA